MASYRDELPGYTSTNHVTINWDEVPEDAMMYLSRACADFYWRMLINGTLEADSTQPAETSRKGRKNKR
jgi:hypothetical protein